MEGTCGDCCHPAGKSWVQQMEEQRDPERLLAEHHRGNHPGENRAYCPECEPKIEARRAAWTAVHRASGHSCPSCDEDRRDAFFNALARDHMFGRHRQGVVADCERCASVLKQEAEAEAHTRGEHDHFDFRDPGATTPCPACRETQWNWYEHGQVEPLPKHSADGPVCPACGENHTCPRCGGPIPDAQHIGTHTGSTSKQDLPRTTEICRMCVREEVELRLLGMRDERAEWWISQKDLTPMSHESTQRIDRISIAREFHGLHG